MRQLTKWISSLSIRNKITIVIFITTIISISIGFTVLMIGNIKSVKSDMVRNVVMNARLMGDYCITPLAFQQPGGALDILEKIESYPSIVYGCVYDENNNMFAWYKRYELDMKPLKVQAKPYAKFIDSYLHVFEPVLLEKERLGTIYIIASTNYMDDKIREFIMFSVILILGLLLFSYGMARWFQNLISGPIMELADFTGKLSDKADFSLRIPKISNDEIGKLYDAFNSMLAQLELREFERDEAEKQIRYYINELERNNKELEEFNYVASHDLREPLRTMTSYCELLKNDLGPGLSEDVNEDITFIMQASKRMNALILDLLQLSRAGRVEFDNVPIDINDCLITIVNDLKVIIQEHMGKVIWDKIPLVLGDKFHISRVLQNLISNAIKFRGDAPPVVKITWRDRAGKIEIAVADNGIGMEKKYLDQIFSPFKRLHGVGQYEGTGIGLAICKKLIERHGGDIWAESEPEKGSIFIFTLNRSDKQS